MDDSNKDKNMFQKRFNEIVGDKSKQEEIAKKIGTSRQNVGNWLSGRAKPDIYSLSRIAEEYNVTTDYLLGNTDIKSQQADIQMICNYTGLHEDAVKNLHNNICKGASNENKGKILNNLLSDERLYAVLEAIVNLVQNQGGKT